MEVQISQRDSSAENNQNSRIQTWNCSQLNQSETLDIAHHEIKPSKVPVSIPKANYVPPLNFSLVEDGIYRSGFPMPINYPFLQQLKIKTIIYLGDLGEEKPKKKGKEGKEKEGKEKEGKDKEGKDKEGKDKEGKDKDGKDKDGKDKKEKKVKKDKYGTSEIFEHYKSWIATTNIKFHHLVMQSSQEPFISNTEEATQKALISALSLMLDKQNFPILVHSNKGKHRIGVLVGLMRKLFQGWCMSGIFEEYEKFAKGKSEYDLEFIELWQPELAYEDEHLPEFVRI